MDSHATKNQAAGWFPGHMLKAQRAMHEALSLVDLAVELVDARAPLASRNPRLSRIIAGKSRLIVANKADLACKAVSAAWTKWFAERDLRIDFIQADRLGRPEALLAAWRELVLRDRSARGVTRPLLRPVRMMIVGIPNIGKSTLINHLRAKNIAKTGPVPGVTRQNQWVPLAGGGIELLDTPGILWPQLRERSQQLLLTLLGNIPDTAVDPIDTAEFLVVRLGELPIRDPLAKLELPPEELAPATVLAALARRRGMLLPGGLPDLPRAATALLKEFRAGRLGRFTLETPPRQTAEADAAEETAESGDGDGEEAVFLGD